ncbi:hypothetical protein [Litoreibacter arenae]|uniref:Uncharacterized protein n=1 Tax=Litoreibacter arenae DSM 19593 TaxID=1123360 RepID=S9RPF9_9RHOB|nr:hypothetical protein [Litoreibacter arenae]EPX79965.1 hypothetical protein thalar_01301 [Litoreibacter arenae DSM 19593]
MIELLLRHYRRFALFAGGLGLYVAFALAAFGLEFSSLELAAIFAAVCVASCAMAVGLYFTIPGKRGLLEVTGTSALICAALIYFTSNVFTAGLTKGIFVVILLIMLTCGIWIGLNGKWSRKIGEQTTWRDRHSGHVPYPARLVWRHAVPGAADPADHCTGMMEHYREDDEDPDTVHVTFKGRKDRAADYTLTFLERDQPSACRFFFQGTEADGTVVDGIFSLRLTVLERDACFMSCVEERCGLSLGRLVERWFDDTLGYQYDKLLEKLDALYGDTYGPRRSSMMAAE